MALVGNHEVLYAASTLGQLDLVEGHVGIARVDPDVHVREVEERLVEDVPL